MAITRMCVNWNGRWQLSHVRQGGRKRQKERNVPHLVCGLWPYPSCGCSSRSWWAETCVGWASAARWPGIAGTGPRCNRNHTSLAADRLPSNPNVFEVDTGENWKPSQSTKFLHSKSIMSYDAQRPQQCNHPTWIFKNESAILECRRWWMRPVSCW